MNCSTTETRIVPLPQPQDVLTDLLRQGAPQLLAQAIESEVADWIDRHQNCRDAVGHRQVVRNGHLPERTITTGVGAEHGMHLRTTNGIERMFATVRLRREKTKGSGTRVACLTMVFKQMQSASRRGRALNGSGLLSEVIKGTVFVDGIKKEDAA